MKRCGMQIGSFKSSFHVAGVLIGSWVKACGWSQKRDKVQGNCLSLRLKLKFETVLKLQSKHKSILKLTIEIWINFWNWHLRLTLQWWLHLMHLRPQTLRLMFQTQMNWCQTQMESLRPTWNQTQSEHQWTCQDFCSGCGDVYALRAPLLWMDSGALMNDIQLQLTKMQVCVISFQELSF